MFFSLLVLFFQEYLREVRDLTEALTKDESALVNHDLANEPERSVSKVLENIRQHHSNEKLPLS